MSNIRVIDNFLPKDRFDFVTSQIPFNVPWNYLNGTVSHTDDVTSNLHDWQMTHVFYKSPHFTSEEYGIVQPIVEQIKPLMLERIKANLSPSATENLEYGMHTDLAVDDDIAKDFTTAIYYVNSNDGYTLFEDGTKVESVANRLVTFPANIKHTGTTCTDVKNRIVINFVYLRDNINNA
jgi:hypothetical protein